MTLNLTKIHLKICVVYTQNNYIFLISLTLLIFLFLFVSVGESLQAHKDTGGLLLLRVRTDPTQGGPCPLLCRNGPGYD